MSRESEIARYERAWSRFCKKSAGALRSMESLEELKETQPDALRKGLFLLIKKLGNELMDADGCASYSFSMILSMVSAFTPREFMQMFPIEKEFTKGKYFGTDYFTCLKYLERIGMDEPIGDRVIEFLSQYLNLDISACIYVYMKSAETYKFAVQDGSWMRPISYEEFVGKDLARARKREMDKILVFLRDKSYCI